MELVVLSRVPGVAACYTRERCLVGGSKRDKRVKQFTVGTLR